MTTTININQFEDCNIPALEAKRGSILLTREGWRVYRYTLKAGIVDVYNNRWWYEHACEPAAMSAVEVARKHFPAGGKLQAVKGCTPDFYSVLRGEVA